MIQIGSGKTLNLLDQMLTDAIDGTFKEHRYDETQLSRLESRWKEYLTSARMSMLQTEKERAHLKTLISDISHQTKTPLSNILLYSELLLERMEDNANRELTEKILNQTEKLEFLIQSLVKMSRLESNILELKPEDQPIKPLIDQALETAFPKALKKEIQLVLEWDELDTMKESHAWYDGKWTGEALENILDNAIKYSPPNSTVNIRIKEYEFYLCINISDEGIGIPPQEKAQIFGRFYRSPQVQQEEGVGIGLYLAREILQKEHGYIKVTSKPNAGSTFGLYLLKQEEI